MPITAEYIKSRIDTAREVIGRNIIFYTPKVSVDYIASGYYNPLTDTSYITTYDTTTVLARVHWAGDERITATPGGKYFIGECTLGVDPQYHGLAQKAQKGGKVIVDGRDMEIIRIDPMGVPEINRYKLVCSSFGKKPNE